MKECWLAAALVPLALFLGGCGGSGAPATYPVSGRVTLDAKAIPDGQIVFRAADGKGRSYAGKIKDGQYTFESAVGQKNVFITAYRDVPGKTAEVAPGEGESSREQYIPAQYNEKTTLNAEVTDSADKNTFDFELTGDAAP